MVVELMTGMMLVALGGSLVTLSTVEPFVATWANLGAAVAAVGGIAALSGLCLLLWTFVREFST